MKFINIKNNYLNRAVSFTYSSKYLVNFTGAQAILLTRNLEYVTVVKKLKHVYDGEISPDEAKLLLPSCNGNLVTVFFLDDSKTIKIKISDDLIIQEGWGCWSKNSNSFYLLLTNKYTLSSVLRKYDFTGNYTDLLSFSYLLNAIYYVDTVDKYLILATEFSPVHSYQRLIWYDENNETVKSLDLMGFDNVAHNAVIDKAEGLIYLKGNAKKIICDFDGNVKELPFNKKYDLSEFLNTQISPKTKELLQKIQIVKRDNQSNRVYVGTSSGLFVFDGNNSELSAKKLVRCGVTNIELLTCDKVMVDTPHGVCFYAVE